MCPFVEEYQEMAKKSTNRVRTMSRILLYMWTYKKESCYRYQSTWVLLFFAVWHSECFELFQIPWTEMLTLLIICLVGIFLMVAQF
jgi:hypothetical protein